MSFTDVNFEPRKCKWCGKEFIPKAKINVYCTKECVKKHQKFVKSQNKQPKPKKKTNQDRIVDIAKEAKAHGMSYGQYVAMMHAKG